MCLQELPESGLEPENRRLMGRKKENLSREQSFLLFTLETVPKEDEIGHSKEM